MDCRSWWKWARTDGWSALVVALVLGTATAQAAAVGAAANSNSDPPGWRLTWADEFEGAALNTSVWNVRDNETHCCGPLGHQELELYVREAVSVKDGMLVLNTRWNPTMGHGESGKVMLFNYTSGWVDTKGKFAQKEGRFAANCSLPPRAAEGIWPAFWLMPDNASQCWPTGGEIDIFEMNGDPLEDLIWGSYHWAEPGECGKDKEPIPGMGAKPPGARSDWQREWHIYAVEWNADGLDFYLDDHHYLHRSASHVGMPTSAQYVIFDQAVSQFLFSPKPGNPAYEGDGVSLRVEWVRAYERAG